MRTIFVALSSLFLLSATAPAPPATPALWKVADADTTIYLFGTVHILKPGTRWLEGPVRTAFDGSDELLIEMVEPEPAEADRIFMAHAKDPDGPALSAKLSPKARQRYVAAMRQLGMNPAQMEEYEPWFVATLVSMLPLQKMGFDANSGAEKTLVAAAKSAGKPVAGLETMEQQIGFFDQLPESDQIAMLNESVAELPETPKLIDQMMRAWASGKPDRLAALLNQGMSDTPGLEKVLMTDRNRRWADWIAARMAQPGTVFMAVGAAHLAGKDSVQAMLATQKLKAERLR